MDSIKFHPRHSLAMWSGLNKEQINNTIKLIKKFKSKKHENISNTDWNVDSNVKREYFDYLWNDCLIPFKNAFCEVTKANELILHNFWFQRYSNNDYHDWHTHGATNFTNILYLQNTEDNPTEIMGVTLDKDIFTPGNLLTFPGHIFHRSNPNKTKKEKIVVSFNTSIR